MNTRIVITLALLASTASWALAAERDLEAKYAVQFVIRRVSAYQWGRSKAKAKEHFQRVVLDGARTACRKRLKRSRPYAVDWRHCPLTWTRDIKKGHGCRSLSCRVECRYFLPIPHRPPQFPLD